MLFQIINISGSCVGSLDSEAGTRKGGSALGGLTLFRDTLEAGSFITLGV